MEWWQIYLLTRVDSLNNFFTFSIFTIAMLLIAPTVMFISSFEGPTFYSSDDEHDRVKKTARHSELIKLCKRFMIVGWASLLTCSLLKVLTPSRDDVAIVIAGHWATHNEEMKKLPDNVLKTLNGLLEKAQEKVK